MKNEHENKNVRIGTTKELQETLYKAGVLTSPTSHECILPDHQSSYDDIREQLEDCIETFDDSIEFRYFPTLADAVYYYGSYDAEYFLRIFLSYIRQFPQEDELLSTFASEFINDYTYAQLKTFEHPTKNCGVFTICE